MKRRKRTSRSTFRAELIVQQQRDEESGLFVSNRFFQPAAEQKPHRLRWTAVNALLLMCLVLGLLRLLVTGFGIPVEPWFYAAAAGMCVLAAALYQSEWCAKHWMAPAVVLLLAYLGLLFWRQTDFMLGMRQLANLGVNQLNETYSGSLSRPFSVTGAGAVQYFLIFITPLAVLWLAAAVLYSSIPILMELLVFPAAAALLLFGAADDMPGKFLLLFGVMLALAFSRTKRQKRMWGGDNEPLVRQNRLRFESIQKTSALAVLIMCLALSIPGFLLIRPLLAISLMPAREYSTQLQTGALNQVMKLLPDLTAGQWNLNVEAVSGGVQDGSLSGDTGYLLEGVEDLRLTVNQKPEDALFLRGYVGANYENGSWELGHAYTFDGASINWNTEGSPRLYIQNLPFLRTAFALAQGGVDESDVSTAMSRFSVTPVQLFVERINANPGYTYVPYGAYLNDYYQIEAGDGPVTGQTEQEDRYFFFTEHDMDGVLGTWNLLDSTANVLDRVEESYRAFCHTMYLSVPDSLQELQAEVDAVVSEQRWQPDKNIDDITAWIRRYMAEHYSYDMAPAAVPEGEDALHYFLFTARRGNSVHFASAAVMLYRMFGIPARYVVGYEASPTLFTVQAGGIYTATVQGDQSQAWAEIYLSGVGWRPRDMTPGVIGTLEEVGPGGIRVEVPEDEEQDDEDGSGTEPMELTEDDVIVLQTETDLPGDVKHGADISLEQIIRWIAMAVGALLVAALLIAGWLRCCRDLGLSPLGRRDMQSRLLGVFQAVYRRARRLKLPVGLDSQSDAFTAFLQEQLMDRRAAAADLVQPAMAALYRSVYGGMPVEKADVQRMRQILLALYARRKKTK